MIPKIMDMNTDWEEILNILNHDPVNDSARNSEPDSGSSRESAETMLKALIQTGMFN